MWWLTLIEIGLRRGTVGALCERHGIALITSASEAGNSPVPWADLHRVAARSTAVLRFWPFESTCLRRCLLIGTALRDERPGLTLGVKRGDDGQIAAHAWLVMGGRSIDPTSDEFDAFTTG